MNQKTKKRANEIYSVVREGLEDLHSIGINTSMSLRQLEKTKANYSEPPKYVAEDIIRIRKKLNISQAVLARIIASSKSTVQKWELGFNSPSQAYRKLLQLADTKGVSVLEIKT
jgi:putative transcriptional regulator